MLVATCWGLAVPAAVDTIHVSNIVRAETRFINAGGHVLEVGSDSGVSAARCDAINQWDSAVASAAITRIPEFISVDSLPDARLPAILATARMPTFLGEPSLRSGTATLSEALSDRIILKRDDLISVDFASISNVRERTNDNVGSLSVSGPIDMSIFGEKFSTGLVFVSAPIGNADVCVVWARPESLEVMRAALPAVLSGDGTDVTVRDRIIRGQFNTDYVEQYSNRPLRSAWIASAIVLVVLWVMTLWTRRSVDGLYASVGANEIDRAIIRISEWLCILTVGGPSALVGGIMICSAFGVPLSLALQFIPPYVGASLCLATVLAITASALVRPKSTLAALKDR